MAIPTFIINFALVNENRSPSEEPLSHEVIYKLASGAIEPRSLNEFDYEIKSYS